MKKSEIIKANYEKLFYAMKEAYEVVVRSNGKIQVGIYIWEDGKIETLEDAQGSSMRLYPRQMETRSLFYVDTIAAPCFDIWDYADSPKPEDEDEAAKMEEELYDWYLDEGINDTIEETLYNAISDAEMDELYNN